MYKKVPNRKKIYKKFLYAFSKIFLKPIDSIFNLTLRANFLERFLTQISMVFSKPGAEGGLFLFLGKKN